MNFHENDNNLCFLFYEKLININKTWENDDFYLKIIIFDQFGKKRRGPYRESPSPLAASMPSMVRCVGT